MEKGTVVFVAFQEQDNLGVGYVASTLLNAGYDIRLLDFRIGESAILEHLRRLNPLVVGFSVIFQHHLDRFQELIASLRGHDIACHFCAGGHYPSLRPVELMNAIPELDSVILFEGEQTFLEMVRALSANGNWKNILGIAYRENGRVTLNPLRPLETDLDQFSPPIRPPAREFCLGKKFSTLLAGRGCVNRCTFCSINEFYSRPPGPLKRVRKPEMVVREIELLHLERHCSIFMFQDDDFPVARDRGTGWATKFCKLLAQRGLDNRILWKISCRPDEVDFDLFGHMKRHGLFLVYLGIESGTDQGLRLMNKGIEVATNLRAVSILKELDILYDYGFMLFDPESTFDTVVENLAFLEGMLGDGSSPVTFCKMLPYAETDIERRLRAEGRLKGCPGQEDYDFKDPAIDRLYKYMAWCFSTWIGDHGGLLNLGRWSRYYIAVYKKYYSHSAPCAAMEQEIQKIIGTSNQFFIDSARQILDLVRLGKPSTEFPLLERLQSQIAQKHAEYCTSLSDALEDLEGLVRQG
jgi:anaerobic magnesium-protoporphyrin IX monomethyl ester cyclase